MRMIHATLFGVALLTLMTVTATAQEQDSDAQGPPGPQGDITKTWELTLEGDVPVGETFGVLYRGGGDSVLSGYVVLCGEVSETCMGNGTVYRVHGRIEEPTRITFAFIRGDVGPATNRGDESFCQGVENVNAHMTNSATYDFCGDGTGCNDQEAPEKLPATGAGGLAGNGFSPGATLAVLSLMVASAYARLRQR